jgi:hypothetical protein
MPRPSSQWLVDSNNDDVDDDGEVDEDGTDSGIFPVTRSSSGNAGNSGVPPLDSDHDLFGWTAVDGVVGHGNSGSGSTSLIATSAGRRGVIHRSKNG